MADIKSSQTIAVQTADPDGLSTAASVGNNAALTLGGALTSGSFTAETGTARQITLLSAGDDDAISFNIVGTDIHGDSQTENVTGVDTGTATSTEYFATVTSITAVGDPAGNMSAGTSVNVAGVVFKGPTRVKGLVWSGGGAVGTVSIRNTSTAGTSLIDVRSDPTLGVNAAINLAADGVLFDAGGYVTFAETDCNSVTVFHG